MLTTNITLSGTMLWTLFMLFTACTTQEDKRNSNPTVPTDTMTEDELLDKIQRATFQYFWDGAESQSGMARERIHLDEPGLDLHLVTTGGTGFGIMAILVAIERGFITRPEGRTRVDQIVTFLESVPRFHGVWAHWYDGSKGSVVPFSPRDDGGDLVETAFLVQGLLCARQYFSSGNEEETALANRIDMLWREVEWNFFRGQAKENVLFWHWSPTHQWAMDFRIKGYNESLITYLLAASSPTYAIPEEVYHEGWASNGDIVRLNDPFDLGLIHQGEEVKGGPLFWAHYSFLGLDPRNLRDRYADYWSHNLRHVHLNRMHCVENPHGYRGYAEDMWGLTASYSINFYAAHSPGNDLGVISPTAALSSFPYTPEYSMDFLRNLESNYADLLWGKYGYYDAFSIHHEWHVPRYLAIDQGPITIMIENYRSGLLWSLFMSCEEVQSGLRKLGFQY